MGEPTITNGEEHFFPIIYEGNGAGQRVGKFVPFTDNGTIPNSLIFNRADNATMTRTPSSAGTRTKFTVSVWVKLGSNFGTRRFIFYGAASGNNFSGIEISANNSFRMYASDGSGSIDLDLESSRTLEDTSKWYHLLAVFDSTQSTASDRAKMYIDGDQITNFSTSTFNLVQDFEFQGTNNVLNVVGGWDSSLGGSPATYAFDGYMAEMNLVDGSALTPDTFGVTDSSTGRWIPKALTGITYGTNGFRLQFASPSNLGDDTSGNTQDFGVNNIVAGDQTTDSPSQNFATGLGAFQTSYAMTMSEGNLKSEANGGTNQFGKSQTTLSFDPNDSSGYYAEYTVNGTASVGSNFNTVGISGESSKYLVPNSSNGAFNLMVAYFEDGRVRFTNGAGTSTDISSFGSTWGNVSTPDIIGIFVKNNKIYFHKNGTYQNSADPNNETGGLDIQRTMGGNRVGFFHVGYDTSVHGIMTANFGQKGFTYTPPTGYKKLNQDNLPETSKGISGFVWIKSRDTASAHMLFDSSRGPQLRLKSDSTSEQTLSQGTVTKFLKGGYAVGDQTAVNKSGDSVVAWNWVANAGTTATNNDGSVTSTVQANTTAGFSIVRWTGGGSAATIGHGLSQTPEWIFYKRTNATGDGWITYHINQNASPASGSMQLQSTGAFGADSTLWNNTAPTSSVISIGTYGMQSSEERTAWVWHPVEGYSKFGTYTGNGNTNGPFVFTGFKPAWIMFKQSNGTADWFVMDSARGKINPQVYRLKANATETEDTSNILDILSSGFKLRNAGSDKNGSGSTYIYIAFAQHPFIGDGTNPVTAR
jgi:hypothetical protein